MTDQFISIVKHFISSDINFALMINGDWGSGKTHYFKNQFETDTKKKIVYTSVFGIKDLKEIDDAIVYQKFRLNGKLGDIVKNPNTKVATSIGKSISKGLLKKYVGLTDDDFKELGNAWSQADITKAISLSDDEVLVIDDLERLDSSISYDDFFGYVSSNYSEGSAIKVILICKEDEIFDRFEGVDDKVFPRYQKIKEKTVWKTIDFELLLENILPSFYDKYQDPFRSYLKENHKHLIKLCKEFNINNLRTLRFFFENLKRPFEVRVGFFEVTDSERIVFETLLILSCHYKEGISLVNDSGGYKFYLSDKFRTSRAINAVHMTSEDIKRAPLEHESNEFNDRYFRIYNHSYRPLKFVFELISSGYFNEEQFDGELRQLEDYYSKNDEWNIAFNKFNYPLSNNSQEEYIQTQKEVFNWIKEEKYRYDELMSIANTYVIWSKLGLKFIYEQQDFFQIIDQALTDKVEYGILYTTFPLFEEANNHDYPQHYLNLCTKGEKIRTDKWQKMHEEDIHNVINSLEKGGQIDELEVTRILASDDPEINKRLVAVLSKSVQSLLDLKKCHLRLISCFMIDLSQARIDKLTSLSEAIEDSVKMDNLKSYVFNTFKVSYFKTLKRFKPQ